MEQYKFFNSTPDDPREYQASEFSDYFSVLLTNGVFNGGTNLQVTVAGTDMNVSIAVGYAWINGYMYKVAEEPLVLAVDNAHALLNRIDRVVVRLDITNRRITANIVKGVNGETPIAPALTRTATIYEISLAQVYLEAGKSFIESDQLTDDRLNASVCGLVNSLVQVDTETMQATFDAFMETISSQGYISVNEFTAESDFLVGGGNGVVVKKTLAETKTLLGVTNAISHTLATAVNDFLVASGAGVFVKKTLDEVKTILGLGTSAYKNVGTGASDVSAGNHAHAGTYEPVDSTIMRNGNAPTMTSILTAQNNTSYTTKQVRNITLSTADPSGGSNGDIWIKYTP